MADCEIIDLLARRHHRGPKLLLVPTAASSISRFETSDPACLAVVPHSRKGDRIESAHLWNLND